MSNCAKLKLPGLDKGHVQLTKSNILKLMLLIPLSQFSIGEEAATMSDARTPTMGAAGKRAGAVGFFLIKVDNPSFIWFFAYI